MIRLLGVSKLKSLVLVASVFVSQLAWAECICPTGYTPSDFKPGRCQKPIASLSELPASSVFSVSGPGGKFWIYGGHLYIADTPPNLKTKKCDAPGAFQDKKMFSDLCSHIFSRDTVEAAVSHWGSADFGNNFFFYNGVSGNADRTCIVCPAGQTGSGGVCKSCENGAVPGIVLDRSVTPNVCITRNICKAPKVLDSLSQNCLSSCPAGQAGSDGICKSCENGAVPGIVLDQTVNPKVCIPKGDCTGLRALDPLAQNCLFKTMSAPAPRPPGPPTGQSTPSIPAQPLQH